MGYLNKEAILKAYKQLSTLSPNPTQQGATQKISAIRYFMALDSFYKSFNRECNTRDPNDKGEYVKRVGVICDVCPNLYTANFYAPLNKHDNDFNVGSNFYSAGQVSKSLVNPQKRLDYPSRGSRPLFRIQNGVLYRSLDLYSNFIFYIGGIENRVAIVIWILRKTIITDGGNLYDKITEVVSDQYTQELVNILLPNADDAKKEIEKYDWTLSNYCVDLKEEDIKVMFNISTIQDCDIFLYNEGNDQQRNLSALRTKPFMLLAGISGTGKSRNVRKLAQATLTDELQRKYDQGYNGSNFEEDRWNLHKPANFELI